MFSNQHSRLRFVIPFSSRGNTCSAPWSSVPRDSTGEREEETIFSYWADVGMKELRVRLGTKNSGAWTLLRSSGLSSLWRASAHNLNHPQTLPTPSWGSSEGTSRAQHKPIDLEPYHTVGKFAREVNHLEFEYSSSEIPVKSVSTLLDLVEGRPWPISDCEQLSQQRQNTIEADLV
jgi:hypothetical protein